MKLDPTVIGKNYILSGEEVGVERPNDNFLVDGISGCGKTTSLIFPNVAKLNYTNPILSFAKEEDAYLMGNYLKLKGYDPWFLNLINPKRSTVSFDPLCSIRTSSDIEGLSTSIVQSVLSKTVDSFWNINSTQLSNSITKGTMTIIKNAGMADVLDLFDMTEDPEEETEGGMSLDEIFQFIGSEIPNYHAVHEYNSWRRMPEKTATSIRATLKGAYNAVFPENIRNMMREKHQIDFERFGKEKIALIIITDATEDWQGYYANLFWYTAIKELKRVAQNSPGGHLQRPARLFFDDFACTSAIANFHKNISLTRSYGISYFILLQGQTQLESIYGAERAAIIRQNCPVQLYFPGGFDDKSCELVSKRMNIPYEDVLYSTKMGKVFVMISGRKPEIIDRYDTYDSKEYRDYLAINGLSETAI